MIFFFFSFLPFGCFQTLPCLECRPSSSSPSSCSSSSSLAVKEREVESTQQQKKNQFIGLTFLAQRCVSLCSQGITSQLVQHWWSGSLSAKLQQLYDAICVFVTAGRNLFCLFMLPRTWKLLLQLSIKKENEEAAELWVSFQAYLWVSQRSEPNPAVDRM